PSSTNAEHERHQNTHDLVRDEKDDRGDRHHDEDHGRGDGGLAPGRPSHLLPLGTDLLHEFEWTDLCHDSCRSSWRPQPASSYLAISHSAASLAAVLAGVEGLEPPTPGFGDRCSSH